MFSHVQIQSPVLTVSHEADISSLLEYWETHQLRPVCTVVSTGVRSCSSISISSISSDSSGMRKTRPVEQRPQKSTCMFRPKLLWMSGTFKNCLRVFESVRLFPFLAPRLFWLSIDIVRMDQLCCFWCSIKSSIVNFYLTRLKAALKQLWAVVSWKSRRDWIILRLHHSLLSTAVGDSLMDDIIVAADTEASNDTCWLVPSFSSWVKHLEKDSNPEPATWWIRWRPWSRRSRLFGTLRARCCWATSITATTTSITTTTTTSTGRLAMKMSERQVRKFWRTTIRRKKFDAVGRASWTRCARARTTSGGRRQRRHRRCRQTSKQCQTQGNCFKSLIECIVWAGTKVRLSPCCEFKLIYMS